MSTRRSGFIRQFEAEGLVVEKVLLDVDDLVRWCCGEGYRVGRCGRAAYGALLTATIGQPQGRA